MKWAYSIRYSSGHLSACPAAPACITAVKAFSPLAAVGSALAHCSAVTTDTTFGGNPANDERATSSSRESSLIQADASRPPRSTLEPTLGSPCMARPLSCSLSLPGGEASLRRREPLPLIEEAPEEDPVTPRPSLTRQRRRRPPPSALPRPRISA